MLFEIFLAFFGAGGLAPIKAKAIGRVLTGDMGSALVSLSKMSEKRFEKVYAQGVIDVMEIWVDKETGVNYLYHYSGNSGGLTPLLDRDGKPVISAVIK